MTPPQTPPPPGSTPGPTTTSTSETPDRSHATGTDAVAADAKTQAAQTADEAKEKAAQTAEAAKEKARDVADTTKAKVEDLAREAKSELEDRATEAKGQAAGALGDTAEVLHDTSDSLREHGHDTFAEYADRAARQVESLTSTLRDRSVGEVLDEAERFARREPALFVGGAFLLGVLGARFLKASASEATPEAGPTTTEDTFRSSASMRSPSRGSWPESTGRLTSVVGPSETLPPPTPARPPSTP